MKTWKYRSENLGGNLHDAARWISKNCPQWDVVAMQFSGSGTVVVWREEIGDAGKQAEMDALEGTYIMASNLAEALHLAIREKETQGSLVYSAQLAGWRSNLAWLMDGNKIEVR